MYYPLRSRASFEVMPDKKIVGATEGQHRDLVIKILINGKPIEYNRSSRLPAYCLIVHVPLSSCPRGEVVMPSRGSRHALAGKWNSLNRRLGNPPRSGEKVREGC